MWILYSADGCHLCDDALTVIGAVLGEIDSVDVVNIRDDEALIEKYGLRIPVIRKAESEDELGWPFAEDDLRDWMGEVNANQGYKQ